MAKRRQKINTWLSAGSHSKRSNEFTTALFETSTTEIINQDSQSKIHLAKIDVRQA
ncbi:MAG: hypothetical protein GY820_48110 [Gammaproteobacteria bacterium]|nr:hypothetical protein [Gammaproteobacteria bacterium]